MQKARCQIGLKKFFVFTKVKYTAPRTYISDLKDEEIGGKFYEKELQKTNQKEFRVEKVIKKKSNKLYVKWKGYNSSFNSWIDKKDSINKYFSKPKSSGGRVKVELDLSNYATKADLKSSCWCITIC